MEDKKIQILEKILYSLKPVSAEELIDYFDISKRTLYYRLSDLKDELAEYNIEICNLKGEGYYIDFNSKNRTIEYIFNHKLKNESDEILDILFYALINHSKINISRLTDIFYYESTKIRKIINSFEKELGVSLNTDYSGTYLLKGNEQKLRLEFVELSLKQISDKSINDFSEILISIFHKFKKQINISRARHIQDVVISGSLKYDMWISEEDQYSLMLYLYILDFRFGINTSKTEVTNEKFNEEYMFSKYLIDELFPKKNDLAEYNNMFLFVLNLNIFSKRILKTDEKIEEVINNIIDEIDYKKIGVIEKKKLVRDLIPHLRYYISKTTEGLLTRENPLLEEIKYDYHQYYEIAEKIFLKFCEVFKIPFTESECSYIAIYLYKNTIEKVRSKINVVIICGTGRGVSKLLAFRVEETFPDINIIKILSSANQITKEIENETDLVLSSVSTEVKNIPVIKVSPLLSNRDIEKIYKYTKRKSRNFNELKNIEKIFFDKFLFNQESLKIYYKVMISLFYTLDQISSHITLSNNAIFGVCIHVMLSIPRLINNETKENAGKYLLEEIKQIEVNYPEISQIMNGYVREIEISLDIEFSKSELYSLYQYILF